MNRSVLGCLGTVGLVVVAVGILTVANWEGVSTRFREAVHAQDEKAEATLFRLGELMSMTAELEARYDSKPDLAYTTDSGVRILSITFDNYRLPEEGTAQSHARQIAAFAIGATTRFEAIDEVEVFFEASSEPGVAGAAGSLGPYSFALDELMQARP